MKLHREGKRPLLLTFTGLVLANILVIWTIPVEWVANLFLLASVVVYLLLVNFFRNPPRFTHAEEGDIVAPADGKIVVIEEVEETEYFKDRRIQISIFMSPLNVHVNRYPISGEVVYSKYHKGEFLVAWHPKSSILNERTTVVVNNPVHGPVLYRQIAGAMARRIVMYAKEKMKVKVGDDSGFIKLGSRVDVLLPIDCEILAKVGDKPVGGETILARLGSPTQSN
ncbi:MAG: phosphatidylserine decarboxylase family protein [Bacteroidota bacterium]|nr:phosphatidylserine decarboxylase family protein [Bacteroidota bacterium]MDX5429019.1 phosphatidylserine decarboxylase family protein [Bacteroidota bacterium]MDX5447794.1 phosphatidylserine decarboxylase family protein [Bacteroidota bacterium]MDX5506683.1 phosphatidylserine decarboxylase family protein [Bacteroidota bacterium]